LLELQDTATARSGGNRFSGRSNIGRCFPHAIVGAKLGELGDVGEVGRSREVGMAEREEFELGESGGEASEKERSGGEALELRNGVTGE
jgi:hypothetical protein